MPHDWFTSLLAQPLQVKLGLLVAAAAIVVVGKLFVFTSTKTKRPLARPPVLARLDPSTYHPYKLKERIVVNHNTRIFRFALPFEDDALGLPIGKHLSFKAKTQFDDKIAYRSYTPITSDDERGYFDLMVKIYDKGVMTRHLDQLKPGDTIDIRGPRGDFEYKPNMNKHIGMLAGGTGITPMLQVIKAVLKNPDDKTQISLIFANVTEADILLREDLDALQKTYSNFRIYYTIDKPTPEWKFGTGFITAALIKEHIAAPTDDTMVLICGPPPMVKAQENNLAQLGFKTGQFFLF